MREVWNIKSIREDALFDIDVLYAEVDGRELSLELPRGLVDLSNWNSLEIVVSKEEEDGDIVMKGIVYKCDGNSLEISIHGLWLRMKVSSCEFPEGEEVYVIVRRTD